MKSNLHKSFKTDASVEQEGIMFEVQPGVSFRIKRFGGFNSPAIQQKMAKFYKPYAKQIEAGLMDPAKTQEIMFRVFVETCVIGWEGVEIDGAIKEFNSDDCVKLFVELPEMANLLIEYASDYKNYREDLGNS